MEMARLRGGARVVSVRSWGNAEPRLGANIDTQPVLREGNVFIQQRPRFARVDDVESTMLEAVEGESGFGTRR